MNRRGHLPTFLIIVVAIALMIAAWFTYLTLDEGAGKDSKQVASALMSLGMFEDYVRAVFDDAVSYAKTKEDFCSAFKSRVSEHDFHFLEAGNFFAIVRNEGCDKLIVGDKIVVKDVFVSSGAGFNKFRREFDLEANLK